MLPFYILILQMNEQIYYLKIYYVPYLRVSLFFFSLHHNRTLNGYHSVDDFPLQDEQNLKFKNNSLVISLVNTILNFIRDP